MHGPSGTSIITDAPVDNQGAARPFSPTDLTCTSLATCILTTMGIKAQQLGIALDGARAKVSKEMSSTLRGASPASCWTSTCPPVLALETRPRLEALVQACSGTAASMRGWRWTS
ncbi:MAG: OsmC family peroxiredoxin [Kiritimatiellia bacterium]